MQNSIIKYITQNQFLATIIIIALAWFAIELKEILVIIFISFIIMATLSPSVNLLKKKRVPRILAVLIPYVLTMSVIILLIIPIIPFFISQLQTLFTSFPTYLDQSAKLLNIKLDLSDINNLVTKDLEGIGKNALLFTSKVFSGVFSLLAIFVISFYFMLGQDRVKKEVTSLFPKQNEDRILATISQIETKLGAWFRGQVILSFSIGFSTWIALTLLGIPFALPLALLAGILEIVPTIGPIISAIPAIIVALSISPTITITVIVFYVVIQMLENNFLVPKIMEKAVGLNPIIIILGVMVGTKLMGVLGALLSVPFITMLLVLFRNLKRNNAS